MVAETCTRKRGAAIGGARVEEWVCSGLEGECTREQGAVVVCSNVESRVSQFHEAEAEICSGRLEEEA